MGFDWPIIVVTCVTLDFPFGFDDAELTRKFSSSSSSPSLVAIAHPPQCRSLGPVWPRESPRVSSPLPARLRLLPHSLHVVSFPTRHARMRTTHTPSRPLPNSNHIWSRE